MFKLLLVIKLILALREILDDGKIEKAEIDELIKLLTSYGAIK